MAYGPKTGTVGRMVTAWGETKNLQGWTADPRCRVSQPSLTERLDKGWDAERAIGTPPTRNNSAGEKRMKVGEKKNRLTLERSWSVEWYGQQAAMGWFRCDCGAEKEILVARVKGGNPKSCGCLRSEKSAERAKEQNRTHGLSKNPIYRQYKSMIGRCKYPSVSQYKDYGGRGISVCREWADDFMAFYEWAIGHGWQEGLTIERVDNDGNYCPENCKIATYREQANNKRSNRKVLAFGEEKNLSQWAEDPRAGASYHTIRDRLDLLGWDAETAITKAARPINRS